MNYEETGVFAGFLEVLLRIELKDIITQLNCDWLQFLDDVRTRVKHMTECVLWLALNIRNIFLPFCLHLFEYRRRHRQLRAASINESGVALMGEVGEVFSIIQHSLTQERPRLEIADVILENLEAIVAVYDLCWIISTKKCIRWFVRITLRDAEAYHGSVDEAILPQRPQEMLLLLRLIFLRRQSEDAVELISEALCFVEGEELKRRTFAILKFLLH